VQAAVKANERGQDGLVVAVAAAGELLDRVDARLPLALIPRATGQAGARLRRHRTPMSSAEHILWQIVAEDGLMDRLEPTSPKRSGL